MLDKNKFRAQAVLKGLSIRLIAERLGVSETTLYRKLNGESDFYRHEIQKLCEIMEIEDPAAIFFAP